LIVAYHRQLHIVSGMSQLHNSARLFLYFDNSQTRHLFIKFQKTFHQETPEINFQMMHFYAFGCREQN
jgi:hypothetical protein